MVFLWMFLKQYDIVVLYIWSRAKRRKIDKLYRETLIFVGDKPNIRPVDVFLSKLAHELSEREKRFIMVIKDFVDGQSLQVGLGVRRSHYLRFYTFPKYTLEGFKFHNFSDFMTLLKKICPFIGNARRRIC